MKVGTRMSNEKMKSQVECIIQGGKQILGLQNWLITIEWSASREEFGCRMTHEPEVEKAIIICNENMLDTPEGIKMLTKGIACRLAELATSRLEHEVVEERKRLVTLILNLLEN